MNFFISLQFIPHFKSTGLKMIKPIKNTILFYSLCKSRQSISFLVIVLFLMSSLSAIAQVSEEWVARYNGPDNLNDASCHMVRDDEGNIYLTGTSGSYDHNGDLRNDYATVKYNPQGEEQWVARYNGPADGYDRPTSIAVDEGGNVYVTGESEALNNNYMEKYDYATVKYNPQGEELWVSRFNGPADDHDRPSALAIDANGNIYVTGAASEYTFNGHIMDEYTTVKYTPEGEEQWVVRFYGQDVSSSRKSGEHRPIAMALDTDGNIYVTGYSTDAGGTGNDFATVKYNPSGEEQWVARYVGENYEILAIPSGNDEPSSIALDDKGNVYVTGYSTDGHPYEDYGYTYPTVKYNAKGEEEWVAIYRANASYVAGDYRQPYSHNIPPSVSISERGDVYIAGATYESETEMDYTVLKYNDSGKEQWIKKYNDSASTNGMAYDLAIGEDGGIYVTGFSTGNGTHNDMATVKYHPSGEEEWVASYNGPDNGADLGQVIQVDAEGNVYLAGYSSGEGTGVDFTLIKYKQELGVFAPTELKAEGVSDSQINLSWQADVEDIDGFVLERATNPEFTGSVAYIRIPADRSSYEDHNKATDVTFYYRIKAVKGDASSDYSVVVSAAATDIPDDQSLIAHAGADQTLYAGDDGTASVTLDGSGSVVPEEMDSQYSWTLEGEEIAAGVNPTVSLGLGTYTITLTLSNQEGATDTDEVVVKVHAASALQAPTVLSARSVSESQINLSWQEYAQEEDGFVLERAVNPDFTGSVAYISLSAGRTSYEDGNKVTGVTFYYRLKAVQGEKASPYSNIASATAGDLSDPTPLKANAGKDQTVTAGEDGTASVTLDASASTVPEATIAAFHWTLEGEEIATGVNPTVNLSVGAHTITLTVSDQEGDADSDEVIIRVQEADEVLAAPAHLSAEGVSESQINLSWQDYALEHDGFVLERATNDHFSGSVAYINIPANTSGYEDRNKATDVTFYYRLKAVKGDISSDYSDIATAAASISAGPAMRLAGSENLDDQNETMQTKEELSLYPNPVRNEFTVEFSNEYEGSIKLMLFDPAGRKLMEREFVKTSMLHKEKLQLSEASLPQGIYFLKLVGQGMEMSQVRLIKK